MKTKRDVRTWPRHRAKARLRNAARLGKRRVRRTQGPR